MARHDCRNKNGPKDDGQKSGNDRNKDIKCFYCKNKGHQIADCHKLKQKQKEEANIGIDQGSRNKSNSNDDEKNANSEVGLGLFDVQMEELAMLRIEKANKHIFIAASGASCYLMGSLEGLVDCLKNRERATAGNCQAVQTTMIGTKKGQVTMLDGIALHGCKHISELAPSSLLLLTRSLSGGCSLGNKGQTIILTKDDFTLPFNHKFGTETGYVAAVEIFR